MFTVLLQMLQAAMAGQMGAGGASSSSSGFSAAVALAQVSIAQGNFFDFFASLWRRRTVYCGGGCGTNARWNV